MKQEKLIWTLLGIIVITLLLIFIDGFSWSKLTGPQIIILIILAVFIGIFSKKIYDNYFSKNKLMETTITPPHPSHKSQAKLVLKENQEFLIKEFEKTFGREDFQNVVTSENLVYVGKNHFKITFEKNEYYIEDLNTKNGTLVNDNEIKGKGKIKLKNEDQIVVAKTIEIRYLEN